MDPRDPSRREVVKRLFGGAAVMGLGVGSAMVSLDDGRRRPGQAVARPRPIDRRPSPSAGLPDLAVIHGSAPRDMVRAAVDRLGGISRFVERGDRVLIKPNIGWERTPLLAANTSPLVVAALIELCRGAGARSVIVGDVSCNDARRSYDRSGIGRAAAESGAEVVLPGRRRFRQTAVGGEVVGTWPVFEPVLECDKLINVPVAKTHTQAGFTCALKNWYGVLGATRGRLHQDIHASIADLSVMFRPTLTVVDAIRVMVRNGPTGGDVNDTRRFDRIVAGVDQVAADAYCCRFVGLRPADVPYLARAVRRGAGVSDVDSLDVVEIELG
jgi:uncharacterized protein (DUF362 family)